jgi:hypothetical protein
MDRRRFFPALGGLALLGACAGEPPPPAAPAALVGPAPIRLDVGSVDVAETYSPADAPTFIDKRRTQQLVDATRAMLQETIQATGGPGYARASIERASMVERKRPVTGGVRGFFLREPDTELVGQLDVRLTVIDSAGSERAYATASISASRSILESTSVPERDRIAGQLGDELLQHLRRLLRQSAEEGLKDYLTA